MTPSGSGCGLAFATPRLRLRAFGGGVCRGLGHRRGVGWVPACHRRRRTTHESLKLYWYQTPTMQAFAELTLSEVQLCYTPGRRGAVEARSPEPVGSPTQNRMRAFHDSRPRVTRPGTKSGNASRISIAHNANERHGTCVPF